MRRIDRLRRDLTVTVRGLAVTMGMCKSHVIHIMGLLQLAPDIQEGLLLGRLIVTEHALRSECRTMEWAEQRTALFQPA